MNAQPLSFIFRGREYAYFNHAANETWTNERCVEVPISVPYAAYNIDMLEFGDVLTQYGYGGHPVIDLRSGNIKEDIRTWEPPQQYGLCISISTLEHIGEKTDHNEIDLRATLDKLHGCCKRLWATIPLGYNTIADAVCKEMFADRWYMRRIGPQVWEECGEIGGTYGKPYKSGNALLIGGWGCSG